MRLVWQIVQLNTVKTFGVVWHWAHGTAWRPLAIGNHVWLNVPSIHVASENLWHESQVVGKPAAMWFTGVVAVL